jgi:hypothetical protein
MNVRRIATAAIALALGNVPTSAASITYTETITASGSLGGIPFTDALVTITALADTDNVTTVPGFPNTLAVNDESATVDIAELGIATFTDGGTHFFVTHAGVRSVVGIAGGTIAQPHPDILDITNSAFSTYDLTTSIGPLSGPASGGGAGTVSFATSAGPLTFDSFAGTTGTFEATLQSVPEPSSLMLAGVASLIGAGLWVRRHRGTAQ